MVAPTTASEKKTTVIGTITRMDENHPKIHDLYCDLVEVKINDSPSNSLYSCFSNYRPQNQNFTLLEVDLQPISWASRMRS
jgi:hypothetical protein